MLTSSVLWLMLALPHSSTSFKLPYNHLSPSALNARGSSEISELNLKQFSSSLSIYNKEVNGIQREIILVSLDEHKDSASIEGFKNFNVYPILPVDEDQNFQSPESIQLSAQLMDPIQDLLEGHIPSTEEVIVTAIGGNEDYSHSKEKLQSVIKNSGKLLLFGLALNSFSSSWTGGALVFQAFIDKASFLSGLNKFILGGAHLAWGQIKFLPVRSLLLEGFTPILTVLGFNRWEMMSETAASNTLGSIRESQIQTMTKNLDQYFYNHPNVSRVLVGTDLNYKWNIKKSLDADGYKELP